MSEGAHEHPNYVKIWAILVVLLCISVVGPLAGIREVTLITAFGIALVKAYLVAKNFMHVNLVQRYVRLLVMTALVFMVLFFAGSAPDVMHLFGHNWEKPSWEAQNAAVAAEHAEAHHH